MAYIEKRVNARCGQSGRVRAITRYRVRYREPSGRLRVETFIKAVDAERRRAEVEVALARSVWRDPRRGEIKLSEWVTTWLPTRHDLRATTRARLETTMRSQVLPRFGRLPLDRIGNGDIRVWVSELLAAGLSAATVRKAVFALRQCLSAAVADSRLAMNPALEIPFPASGRNLLGSCPGSRSSNCRSDAAKVRGVDSYRCPRLSPLGRGGRSAPP